MYLALVALIATTTPVVAVVSDGTAMDETKSAASHLSSTSKVTATAIDHAVTASCVHTTACAERPTADFIVSLTSTTGGAHIDVELVDKTGVSVAHEAVDVTDPALADAALAPALDRIAAAAQAHAPNTPDTSSSSSSSSASSTANGNSWVPWVVGGVGACGACVLGGGLCVLLSAATTSRTPTTTTGGTNTGGTNTGGTNTGGTNTGGTNTGGTNTGSSGSSFANACSAPFNACGSIGNACTGAGDSFGNACGSVGNSCSSAGSGLGNACDGLGNIGSCAVAPGLALQQAAPRPPDETGREYAPGAMRY